LELVGIGGSETSFKEIDPIVILVLLDSKEDLNEINPGRQKSIARAERFDDKKEEVIENSEIRIEKFKSPEDSSSDGRI
jgi:hypothetical protein